MRKDKLIKKMKKKIKKLGEAVNFVEEYADHTYATNYNAIAVICSLLGIEHEVDMDGLYVAGEKVTGEVFTKKEMVEVVKRNNWPINTGCSCKGAGDGGLLLNSTRTSRVSDKITSPNIIFQDCTTSTAIIKDSQTLESCRDSVNGQLKEVAASKQVNNFLIQAGEAGEMMRKHVTGDWLTREECYGKSEVIHEC